MENKIYKKYDKKIAIMVGIICSIIIMIAIMKRDSIDSYSEEYNQVRLEKRIPIIEKGFVQRGSIWENNSIELGHYAKNIVLEGNRIIEEHDYYKLSKGGLVEVVYTYEKDCIDLEVVNGDYSKDSVCYLLTKLDTLIECSKLCP